ncbi:MAG: alanyl-tRNA editing protein [Lachnospiraceae bacterium]|nr:alanyl-tRNA editing protein [Lachnospiraceae bacterium]
MMEKLFYQDTHIIDFEAIVTDCTPEPDGRCRITLDKTAFFPEEGGQGADKGTLEGLEVLDVQIKNDIIYHYLPKPLETGSTVHGHVDWAQRFDYMQQHSGEHIVSGLVHARFGYDNVGFHLGKEEVTLDFNGSLTLEQMREIELAANQVIWQNLPVNVSFPTKEVLDTMEYRSKIELTGDVRIVEIPGIDICACCAPHVETTGQIGILKVTGLQSHRGGVRVNILCGERALREFSMHQHSVAAISALLSAKQDAVAEAVVRLKDEALRLKERANELQADLLSMQTALLPSPDEQDNVVLFTGELDNIALRNTVNSLCEKYKGYCCVFSGNDIEGYRFIIGSCSLDCRKAAALLREQLGAKGGGTAPMVQGSVKASQKSMYCALKALFNFS